METPSISIEAARAIRKHCDEGCIAGALVAVNVLVGVHFVHCIFIHLETHQMSGEG